MIDHNASRQQVAAAAWKRELEQAIVRAVAALDGYRDEYGVHCAFLQCRLQEGYGYAFSDDTADVPHAPDCPVTRARALLRREQRA